MSLEQILIINNTKILGHPGAFFLAPAKDYLMAFGPYRTFIGPRMCLDMWDIILRFHRHMYLQNWMQFGCNKGGCTKEYSMHAR